MKARKLLSAFLLSGLLVLLARIPSHALALSDLENLVRRGVRDTGTASQRYSDTIIDDLLNEGQRQVVSDSWCILNTTFYVLTSGTSYYNLPNDFLAIRQVNFRDSSAHNKTLDEKSDRQISQENPDWIRQSGPPINYVVRYSTSNASTLSISYIPIPTTSSTGTVTIQYFAQVTDLSSDSDIPYNSLRYLYPYHDILADYAIYKLKLIEGMTSEAQAYLQIYTAKLQLMDSKFKNMPNFFPSVGAASTGTR